MHPLQLRMAICLGLISRVLYMQDFKSYNVLIYLLIHIAFFSAMICQVFVVWKYFPETKNKFLEELGKELSR
jgi:hypothetical protein